MILVDTSVWISHLRDGDRHLEKLLLDGEVMCHSHVIGELACGNLKNRRKIISLLQALPMAPQIGLSDYLHFTDQNQLSGRGIGFVDIHLLASSRLALTALWTLDKRLRTAASDLGLNYKY